jgi:hypothetical protein
MPIFPRDNARYGDPVRLNAQFFSGGVLFDPPILERVEIYRGGDGTENGGVLVDTVDSANIFQTDVGLYYIILDLLYHASPSPAPLSPEDPAAIIPQMRYYDRWIYREEVDGPEVHSVGLSFYLYPSGSFVCDDTSKWRFEMKPDRKRIVKGENLDIRLQIIPVPLYRSRREPIVDYLMPISTMRYRLIDVQNNQLVDWTTIAFTGKEGILPTNIFAALQLGEYHVIAELTLPNGQSVRYPRLPVMLVD